MKKLLLIIFMLITVISWSSEKIILVSVPDPDNESLESHDMKCVKKVFENMGIEYSVEYYPWNRCVELIETGKADAMFSLRKTEERERKMIFPSEGLVQSEWKFFYRKDKKIKYEKMADLSGLRIAATTGYAYGEEFWGNKDIIIDEGYDDIVNMKKVANGRVDLFLCNKSDGIKILKDLEISSIDYSVKSYKEYPLYLVFSKKERNVELAQRFSEVLKKFKKSNEYKKIYE